MSLKERLKTALLLFRNCPACTLNLLTFVCEVGCAPQQSKFMWANMSAERPDVYTGGIPAATVLLSENFANGLYESCKYVHGLLGISAMPIACGTKECSTSTMLDYWGGLSTGQAPFPITFKISNSPWQTPDGNILEPLNTPAARCDRPLTRSSDFIGKLR